MAKATPRRNHTHLGPSSLAISTSKFHIDSDTIENNEDSECQEHQHGGCLGSVDHTHVGISVHDSDSLIIEDIAGGRHIIRENGESAGIRECAL